MRRRMPALTAPSTTASMSVERLSTAQPVNMPDSRSATSSPAPYTAASKSANGAAIRGKNAAT